MQIICNQLLTETIRTVINRRAAMQRLARERLFQEDTTSTVAEICLEAALLLGG